MGDNNIIEAIANRVWDVFSLVNGNPDYGFSTIRFSISLFFLFLLYFVIRMRVISSYQTKHIVAMAGIIFMIFREATMLVLMTGWEIKIFYDPIIHTLWPPIEHGFEGLSFLCLMWYSVETAKLYKVAYYINKFKYAILSLYGIFCIYAVVVWKNFFISKYPNLLYSYKECMIDWQSHGIISIMCSVGFYAAFQKQAKYLMFFWGITLFEHFTRTMVYYAHFETSEIATIFHAIHTWSLPFLILHFVDTYVTKITNCGVCRREILL